MKLSLETKLPLEEFEINYNSKIISIGSCFANSIGGLIERDALDIAVNPFEILFDPISIRKAVNSEHKLGDESPFIKKSAGFVSFNFHSSVSAESEELLKQNILNRKNNFLETLQTADILFVTFGTAYVYKHIASGNFVANCHKMPATDFSKELIKPEEELTYWLELLTDWNKLNPKLKVVFTISPVRHSKNGLRENNLSKGVLHLLVDKLIHAFEFVHYFPAYEIVMDELRDYRFFREDLVHPTKQAVEIVYEHFASCYYTKRTEEAIRIKRKLERARAHSFLNPTEKEKASHQELIKKLENQFQDVIK